MWWGYVVNDQLLYVLTQWSPKTQSGVFWKTSSKKAEDESLPWRWWAATAKSPEKLLLHVHHTTIHERMEFQHKHICVDTNDY